MLAAGIGMAGFAVLHGFLQMLDAFVHMRAFHSRALRMLERFFCMLDTNFRVSFFAVRRSAPGMFNRLIDMFIAG